MSDSPDPVSMSKALDEVARNSERIKAMSEEMIKHREEILQSTRIKKLVAVYSKLAHKA